MHKMKNQSNSVG